MSEPPSARTSEPGLAASRAGGPAGNRPLDLLRLARPKQWSKSLFVLIGPLYGLRDATGSASEVLLSAVVAAMAFALASSACYVVNDLADAPKDRHHPRKRRRPIASGAVSPKAGIALAIALALGAAALVFALPAGARLGVGSLLGLYVVNVLLYTASLKHHAIGDVLSLAMGFVLRMLAGCAAAGVSPSTWLLNCTLFLSMFLAFGKRLGERRTLGPTAAEARGVQAVYTDELLRMAVVVTAVATLVAYASYIQAQDARQTIHLAWLGIRLNFLWITTIPACYALLRCIVLLERGTYDDPTELATRDGRTMLAGVVFAGLTATSLILSRG